MAIEVNLSVVAGRLGADAEPIADGRGAKASIASHRRWEGKDGQWQERTSWIPIKAWGFVAERMLQRWKKGDMVHAEGRLEVSSWEGTDGQPRSAMELVALRVTHDRQRDDQGDDQGDDIGPPPATTAPRPVADFTTRPGDRTSSRERAPRQTELVTAPPPARVFDDDEIPF